MLHLTKIGNVEMNDRSVIDFSFRRFSSLFFGFVVSLAILMGVNLQPAHAAGPVDVISSVDRNQLGPDDTFILTITVSSSDEVSVSQPNLPPINSFEILNEWTGQEASTSVVRGPRGMERRAVQATKFNFMLQPKGEGTFTIGAIEVVVDGRSRMTKPITVKVAKGLSAPAGGGRVARPNIQAPPGFENDDDENDLFTQLLQRGIGMGVDPSDPMGGGSGASRTLPINPNDAFFVQVETDKTEAYVGEQITVSFYLYTRGQIRDLDTLKYPSLRGFWKEDIEIATHLNFMSEVVNGLPYKKALLASFALFPIKEGPAVIDSYTAKCSVMALDAFGGMGFGKAYTYTKSSNPVKVNIKALPVEGRPADFSGAVGDFQVTSRVEDKGIVSNQPFTYKVRFEGKGNAKLIELPPFQPPEGLEQYDIQKDSKFFRTGTSYKDFSIQLIPRHEGEFTIPGIAVSVFDPSKKAYVQKTTDAVRVVVGVGQGPTAGGSMMKGGGSGSASSGAAGVRVDEPPRILTEMREPWAMSRAQFAFSFPVLLLGLFGVLGFKARTELGWGQKKKDLLRRLRARLRRVDARVSAGDWRGVGVEMTNAVYFVLGEISGEGGANMELDKLMKKAPPSVRRELSAPLAKQMEIFQVLSFAPESVVGDLKNADRLRVAVSEMAALMEKAVNLGLASGQASDGGVEARETV